MCGGLGTLMVLLGILLFLTFFGYHSPDGSSPIGTGPTGHYFVAFSGCATLAWGGCLIAGARNTELGRALAVPTVIGLVMSAVYRMVVWIVGDYYIQLGNLPRTEAAIFLVLALAFVWLRPRKAGVGETKKVAIPRPSTDAVLEEAN